MRITPEILTGMKKPEGEEVDEVFLESETAVFFEKMKESALRDGIEIRAVSGFRSFERQREIWNKKVDELIGKVEEKEVVKEILRWTAFPGTSRHGWGTDVDITGKEKILNPLQNENYREGGIYHNVYLWLKENAEKFGFYQVYIEDSEERGIEEWHWSYATKSIEFLKFFLEEIKPDFLKGRGIKLGDYVLNSFNDYVKNYMLRINPHLYPIPSTR